MFDQDTLNSAWGNAATAAKRPQQQAKKGPGGIAGFLVNSLPAITSGIGAIGGSFLAPGAGTVGGGAAGGALGEFLKRKITGQKEDLGQIATQGIEGGALSGVGNAFKGVKAGAQALTKLGTGAAEKEAVAGAEKTGSSFMKNLTTQGQQAQGRVAGVSAGSKVAGKELTPQDTAHMLDTLKTEGITTGNANNTLRDVVDKQKGYGQQIADHFKTNDAPLHPEDTKVIADNFLKGIPTTDSRVLDEAKVLADDLQKNVKSTKSLWEFRKTLDTRIPDAKLAAGDNVLSNKLAAIKNMRSYLADELGNVPGMKNYHDLAEVKPFVSAEAKRLNNPGGGIVGRLLSSGPVQKTENALGKVTEKVGQAGTKETPQAVDTMAAGSPPSGIGDIPDATLQAASDATKTFPEAASATNPNFMQKLVGATATPVANPGQTGKAAVKQAAGRGFGIPAAVANTQQQAADQAQEPDISGAITQASSNSPETSSDPFAPENVQANVQAILQQGGKQKDVAEYLSNVDSYQKLTTPSGSNLNATQQQQANNANSALSDIQSLGSMLAKDPSLTLKSLLPGGSITQRLTGTTDYEAAKNNIVDVISRLRSGAAISASEEKLYKSLLPSAGDTQASANSKLQRLTNLFSGFANPGTSSSPDVTDLLANSGQ